MTNWENLPLTLTAKDVAGILGVGIPTAYEILHRNDVPAFRPSPKRLIISRDKFKKWLENQGEVIA
ncbi:MAG: helix-turn-helix domain-containing protein [Chitinispirillales bacterium]|jgi:excisionase family DNA binding protein|nr:helix-turn-helix domain-containing protein [Chitinispirillales bacterium]